MTIIPDSFPSDAPSANPVFYRTYSRMKPDGSVESWPDVCDRTVEGIQKLGKLTESEATLLKEQQLNLTALPSGRWLWVGGTEWVESPNNFYGAYNCSSTTVDSWDAFGYMMNLAMQGCGTGADLAYRHITKLPIITTSIVITEVTEIGTVPRGDRVDETSILSESDGDRPCGLRLIVGDSREGWVAAYQKVLELSSSGMLGQARLTVDLSNVRPKGERLKGFGGVANPIKLPKLFARCAEILNGAIGQKLTAEQCCLLIDEAALVVVAGSIRRSAGIRQFDESTPLLKQNLWVQSEDGQWSIDPKRDALRMANHTRVFHRKPTLEECIESVRSQYYSGEGAIQWAGEAERRAQGKGRYGLNPCVTADTWVHTEDGPAQVKDLLGKQKKLFVHGELFDTTPEGFFCSGTKQVFKLSTAEGYELRLTANHKVLKVDGLPMLGDPETQWTEAQDLVPGDRILLHNHREHVEWKGMDASIGYLRGLFDERAEVQHGKVVIPLNGLTTLREAQRSLARLGIISSLNLGHGELTIQGDNLFWFQKAIGFRDALDARKLNEAILSQDLELENFTATVASVEPDGAEDVYDCTVPEISCFDANGFVAHNCGEIIGENFMCNLAEVHLNRIDPFDLTGQRKAFTAAAIAVSALLNHKFDQKRYADSREEDPIVGVSITGLFDFFVNLLGVDWLKWWEAGRPENWFSEGCVVDERLLNLFSGDFSQYQDDLGLLFKALEVEYLSYWRTIVEDVIEAYCDRHELKCPNRTTTVQPAGCCDKDALRIFDQGLLYADEIIDFGSGETEGLDLSVRGGVGAGKAIANEPLNLIKITLKNGRTLRMTPNHRLSIGGQWVRADKMTPGMKVDFSIGQYQKQENALLLSINSFSYTKEGRKAIRGHALGYASDTITSPAEISQELSYFIGALFGNGCNSPHNNRTRFAHENFQVLEKLRGIGNKLFGLPGTVYEDKKGGKFELTFSSVQLYDWLTLNGLSKTEKSKNLDRIPAAIRRSSKECILSFFAGLIDTDGCPRGGGVSIDMASERFIRAAQQVAESVGLCFSVGHNTKGENFQEEKSIWTLGFSRMASKPDAIAYLNAHSIKCANRPLQLPARLFKFTPYAIESIEWETVPDYSFDFAVEGVDDDDSWYWQGAIKSHNTKSLLTGASPGWHPPKAQQFIRRITMGADDPVALACIDRGYNVVPSQDSKDEQGNLLDDPFDPRVDTWLVEIPTKVCWADLPGVQGIDISKFTALAQFDFYMQVQQYYTTHNSSATLELREGEIEALGTRIYDAIANDEGYISAAILGRFDDIKAFPRLPFEPITKEEYEVAIAQVLERRVSQDFHSSLLHHAQAKGSMEELMQGPAGCDGDKCLIGDVKTSKSQEGA